MGTHGLSGLEKVLIGSTTERMLRRASVPILAVPSIPVWSKQRTGTGASVARSGDLGAGGPSRAVDARHP